MTSNTSRILPVNRRSAVARSLEIPAGATAFAVPIVPPPFPSFMGFAKGKKSEEAHRYYAGFEPFLSTPKDKDAILSTLKAYCFHSGTTTFIFSSDLRRWTNRLECVLDIESPKGLSTEECGVLILAAIDLDKELLVREDKKGVFYLKGCPYFGRAVKGFIADLFDAVTL